MGCGCKVNGDEDPSQMLIAESESFRVRAWIRFVWGSFFILREGSTNYIV